MNKGKFISFEGSEGCGKSTQIKKLGNLSKSQLVEACGYIIPAEGDKKQRLDYTSFYEALLSAKGIDPRTGADKAKK